MVVALVVVVVAVFLVVVAAAPALEATAGFVAEAKSFILKEILLELFLNCDNYLINEFG